MNVDINYHGQVDWHRRQKDATEARAKIARDRQHKRNRKAWLKLAKAAIDKGMLDIAIARIEQARAEYPDNA